jgi:hypothetical protein
MATNILSSALSKASFTLTNVTQSTDGSTVTTVSNLKVKAVTISLKAKIFRHKREDGVTIVDSKILLPIQVDVDAFVPDIDTLQQLNALLSDRSSIYKVSSKGLLIDHLMTESAQIRQSAEVISASPVRLSFKELMFKDATPTICAQSTDSSLTDRGIATLNSVSTTVSDLINEVL